MKKYLLGLLLFLGIGSINFGITDSLVPSKSYSNFSSSSKYMEITVSNGIFCLLPYQNALNEYSMKIAYLDGGFDNNSNLLTDKNIYVNSMICFNQSVGVQVLASSSSYNFYIFENIGDLSHCDCSSVESDLATCQSDLSIATGSLVTCQSNLSIATGSLATCQSNYSICQSDYSSCQSDYSSCSNSLGVCGTSLNSCNVALGNCMQGDYGTGVNWSALFINGIQHVGKPLININIPEEISWDYTGTENSFDLDVNGYNVDSDYIQSVIDVQNYIPTTEDFTEVFSNFKGFAGLIVVCLFVIFVFYMIKKIF